MMWRLETGLICCLCVATMLLSPCAPAGIQGQSRYGQDCDTKTLYTCGPNESCNQENIDKTAKCTCEKGYEYIGRICVKMIESTTINVPSPNSESSTSEEGSGGGNSVAAILLVPTCLVIIGALAYFGARRFKWVQRFRQFRQNRYGSVLVTRDDTDDDDPPIA